MAQQGKEDPPVIFAQLTQQGRLVSGGPQRRPLPLGEPAGQHHHRRPGRGVPEMTLEYVLRQHGLTPR